MYSLDTAISWAHEWHVMDHKKSWKNKAKTSKIDDQIYLYLLTLIILIFRKGVIEYFEKMGLLSILKKLKEKEKEVRILML